MKTPCIRVVNENLRRVELGMPLTESLRVLNQSCEFRKKYEDMYGKCAEGSFMKSSLKLIKFKCKLCGSVFETHLGNKRYCKKCYLIHSKRVNKRYCKKYQQRPEVKERMREYRQKPEVKERNREYQREYNQKNKDKINKKAREKYALKNKEKF